MEDNISILVVEDESKIRIGLRDFLEFHGFTVTEALDGLEAERIVEERGFDLILLDLMLPKISGEQLCTKWRRAAMNTPIIMLTAKGQEAEKITGLDIGTRQPFQEGKSIPGISGIAQDGKIVPRQKTALPHPFFRSRM